MVTENTSQITHPHAIATATVDTSNGELLSAYTNASYDAAKEIINLTPRQEPIVKLATYNDLLPFQKWWGKYQKQNPEHFCIPVFNPDVLKLMGAQVSFVNPLETDIEPPQNINVPLADIWTESPIRKIDNTYNHVITAYGEDYGTLSNQRSTFFSYCLKIAVAHRNNQAERHATITVNDVDHDVIEFGLCPQSFADFGTAKAFIQALKDKNPLKRVQNFLLPKQIDEKGDQRINLMSEPDLDNNVKSYPAFEFNGQILCYYPGKKDKYEKQPNGYYYHRGVEDINNVLVIKPLQWIETEQGDLISLPCIGGISPSKIEDFLTKDPLGLHPLLCQQKCAQYQQLTTDPVKSFDYTTTSYTLRLI